MNYWPAENCNLTECHQPFLQYIATEAQRPDGSWQQLARSEGLRGWTIKTQSNIFGYTDWNINRPANAWYCMHLWQHYAYTLDMDYLNTIAFPVMRSACEYWFDRLIPVADGILLLRTNGRLNKAPGKMALHMRNNLSGNFSVKQRRQCRL